ncbi:uncharacterized protein PAC_12551 [Phialocephala subalpina]|uniref:DUF7708 domain-containing protein n=1 Tax=Phialocephala subalpina TaxID=576137 RepID=A0A1L7XC87_9HELO|nr:uncharacterized protein PAC_12551 [Phialocephala subalpina]
MSTGLVTCVDKPSEEPDDSKLKEMVEKLWDEAERKYAKNKKRAEQLRQIRGCDSVEEVLKHELNAYQQKIAAKNKTRAGRAGEKLTQMCTYFSKFLESFSGIAEIVKGVNGLGGGVAYGGLSILLTVARNKQEREECIGGYLKDMTSWLEDLRDYRTIYQSPKLHEPIFAIYKGVFQFVLSVWEYYTFNALVRLWENIVKPPKYTIKDTAGEVEKSVRRLLAVTAKLLHESEEDSNRKLNELYSMQKEDEVREWKDITMSYRRRLRLKETPWTAVEYKRSLIGSQNRYRKEPDLKNMQLGSKKTLENDEHFKRWLSCPHCSVLIITAVNHANSPLGSDLWLSLALVNFVEDKLTDDDTSQVIFHPIQANEQDPLLMVLGILCGILSLSQNLFREHKQAIDDWVTEFEDPNKSRQRASSALFKLVENLLRDWSARNSRKTLFVVVDRLDICLARREEKESLRRVLKFFLSFGEIGGFNEAGKVKVFFLAAHNNGGKVTLLEVGIGAARLNDDERRGSSDLPGGSVVSLSPPTATLRQCFPNTNLLSKRNVSNSKASKTWKKTSSRRAEVVHLDFGSQSIPPPHLHYVPADYSGRSAFGGAKVLHDPSNPAIPPRGASKDAKGFADAVELVGTAAVMCVVVLQLDDQSRVLHIYLDFFESPCLWAVGNRRNTLTCGKLASSNVLVYFFHAWVVLLTGEGVYPLSDRFGRHF